MHFEYSVHAEQKLKERRISKSEVEEVLKGPEDMFLDIETGRIANFSGDSRPWLHHAYLDDTTKPLQGGSLENNLG